MRRPVTQGPSTIGPHGTQEAREGDAGEKSTQGHGTGEEKRSAKDRHDASGFGELSVITTVIITCYSDEGRAPRRSRGQ